MKTPSAPKKTSPERLGVKPNRLLFFLGGVAVAGCNGVTGVADHFPTPSPADCAKVPYAVSPDQPIATRNAAASVVLLLGNPAPPSSYLIQDVVIRVLTPDSAHVVHVKDYPRPTPQAHRLAITFRGVSDSGTHMPVGKYPVVFTIRAVPVGDCKNYSPPVVEISGGIGAIDWRG